MVAMRLKNAYLLSEYPFVLYEYFALTLHAAYKYNAHGSCTLRLHVCCAYMHATRTRMLPVH